MVIILTVFLVAYLGHSIVDHVARSFFPSRSAFGRGDTGLLKFGDPEKIGAPLP